MTLNNLALSRSTIDRVTKRRNDQDWMKHTLTWFDTETGCARLDYRPVHTFTLSNDVAYIEPKARTY